MSFDNGRYEVSAPGFGDRFARKMRQVGHWLEAVPGAGFWLAPILTGAAALMETTSSTARGEYSKAFKQALSGSVDTVVTAFSGMTWWLGNGAWALVTGNSLAEQARQTTNWMLDSVDDMTRGGPVDPLTVQARTMQVLGASPMTRGAAVGGVGFAPGMEVAMGPNTGYMAPGEASPTHYTDMVAQQRGQNPAEARANWMRDGENRMTMQDLVAARREQEQLAAQQAGKA